MYLYGSNRNRLGQADTDFLTEISTPLTSVGLSPLWIGGLGLLALAFLTNIGGKGVKRVKRSFRKRAQKKRTIAALESQIKSLKSS